MCGSLHIDIFTLYTFYFRVFKTVVRNLCHHTTLHIKIYDKQFNINALVIKKHLGLNVIVGFSQL